MKKKIKLDANENTFSFPCEIMKEIKKTAGKLSYNLYPDSSAQLLRKEIADYTGREAENIITGNGSDELLLMIMLAFGGNGREVIIPVPTFSMYEVYARVSGSSLITIALNPNFSLNKEKLNKYLYNENEG